MIEMIRHLMLGLAATVAVACTDQATPPPEQEKQAVDNSLVRVIAGTVWYRERMALPPGAEVKVVLEDQSRMDAPATPITDYTHVVDGPGPYSFRLVYDPSAIDDRMSYGLRARIEHDGKLLFTSTERIDPFATPAGEELEIMVSMVGGRPEGGP